ncbi:hypothetical protein DINM_004262 [Dirofilaria immitis]|nr:hypothetical protein [Dirofilaria immitis]
MGEEECDRLMLMLVYNKMSSSNQDQEDSGKNRIKRQSVDSPLAVMSPSVRPQSTKLVCSFHSYKLLNRFRLSKTPLGSMLANINQVDPNIDSTLLEQCSVKKEASVGRSFISECDDTVNITDVTSSSIAAALSPRMSNDMKSAIKTYLKSTLIYSTSSLESKTEQLDVVDNVLIVGSEDPEKLNMGASTWISQERTMERNSEDSVEVDLSMPTSEVIETTSGSGILYEAIETKDIVEASFTDIPVSSPVLQIENAESLIIPKCLAIQVGEVMISPDMPENLTLSARKNKVLTTRNLKLDNLTSPQELASYAEERAQNYSFLINEAYCDTSVFCENCYAMRIELGLFSDKFAALTATVGSSFAEENMVFMAKLENLLRRKQAEIVTLSSKLRELTEANDQLSKEKEIVEKDAKDHKFFFKNEMKKKSEEINILRRKLYEAEDLIDKLKRAKSKQSCMENISEAEECQVEMRIKIMEEQLDTTHSLHRKAQGRITELENKLQKIAEEKNQFSLKLRETIIDLENGENNQMSDGSSHVLIISLLKAKVAELENKIDEALRIKEDETVKHKSFLFEKLTSLLEKIKRDMRNNVFAREWETDDVEISVIYFEKAVNIICQDTPQFETLVRTVARHEKLIKNKFKQLRTMMEEATREKERWEMLFTSEKSRLDSFQEMMLVQFSENKNCFSNLLQDFQKKWADILCSVAGPTRKEFEENRNHAMLEILHHIADLQEKLNGKWSKNLDELQQCFSHLKEQDLILTSFLKSEMQKVNDKIEMLHESIGKNLNAILDNLQADDAIKNQEAKHRSLVDSIKNHLDDYKRERDGFNEICGHSEEMMQDLKRTIEQLQKVQEGIRSENATLYKNLDFGRENFARIIRITENLTLGNDKLENENIESTTFRLAKENTSFKQVEKMSTEQDKKIEELEHRLNLLQKENERLGKACDDADDEVGDLKQQIFELLHVNAKLQAEMYGESEEAINRRVGYIEPLSIQPRIHPSTIGTILEMNSSKAKLTDMTGILKCWLSFSFMVTLL